MRGLSCSACAELRPRRTRTNPKEPRTSEPPNRRTTSRSANRLDFETRNSCELCAQLILVGKAVLLAADRPFMHRAGLVQLESAVRRLLAYARPQRLHLARGHRLEPERHLQVLAQHLHRIDSAD